MSPPSPPRDPTSDLRETPRGLAAAASPCAPRSPPDPARFPVIRGSGRSPRAAEPGGEGGEPGLEGIREVAGWFVEVAGLGGAREREREGKRGR
ncbi:hypothetical protein GUJ93_ZPchr0002g23190 [Zizania palustris]|uniref:Uncharacterized protein n=1 Tax=Zizania palustris TaxID=103762 RepID=A0A8J5S1W4_ZIZPA|nr:hypothetical protein GUJ93_ZPchr0002g23190 [Zizania palustris]